MKTQFNLLKIIFRLDNLLLNDSMISKFLKALSYISIPAVIVKYYISKMYKSQKEDEIKAIQESLMTNMFTEMPDSKKMSNMQGNMFKNIVKHRRKLEKILSNRADIFSIKEIISYFQL